MNIKLYICAFALLSVASTTQLSYATHFDGIGYPYGGCGVPEQQVGYQHYLALNVQNTPLDYSTYLKRPIADSSKVGTWKNGQNCGRFIRVKIERFCQGGVNSGGPGTAWCQGGHWETDSFTGAYLDFIVTDSCQDGNRWCRDDTYHVDLKTEALAHFILNGKEVDLNGKWGNREVSWEFIEGPKMPIKIYWMANAMKWWPAMMVTGVTNGISLVQQKVNGQWQNAQINGDMGQSWILPGANQAFYEIQVFDVNGKIYQNKSFSFNFPSSCPNQQCGGNPVYEVAYLSQSEEV